MQYCACVKDGVNLPLPSTRRRKLDVTSSASLKLTISPPRQMAPNQNCLQSYQRGAKAPYCNECVFILFFQKLFDACTFTLLYIER